MDYDVQNEQQVPVIPCKVGAALCQRWEAPHIKQFRWQSDLCDAVPQVIPNIYRNCKYCTICDFHSNLYPHSDSSTRTFRPAHTSKFTEAMTAPVGYGKRLRFWLVLYRRHEVVFRDTRIHIIGSVNDRLPFD